MHSPVTAALRAESAVNHAERYALVRVNLQLTRALAINQEKINASEKIAAATVYAVLSLYIYENRVSTKSVVRQKKMGRAVLQQRNLCYNNKKKSEPVASKVGKSAAPAEAVYKQGVRGSGIRRHVFLFLA